MEKFSLTLPEKRTAAVPICAEPECILKPFRQRVDRLKESVPAEVYAAVIGMEKLDRDNGSGSGGWP